LELLCCWFAFFNPCAHSTLFHQPQLLVIVISSAFYALVDWNANRIMKSIKSLIAHEAAVIRDGKQQIIQASDIVIGDVVLLNAGDRVPADIRIAQASSDLHFDRSLLTGERSVPYATCLNLA